MGLMLVARCGSHLDTTLDAPELKGLALQQKAQGTGTKFLAQPHPQGVLLCWRSPFYNPPLSYKIQRQAIDKRPVAQDSRTWLTHNWHHLWGGAAFTPPQPTKWLCDKTQFNNQYLDVSRNIKPHQSYAYKIQYLHPTTKAQVHAPQTTFVKSYAFLSKTPYAQVLVAEKHCPQIPLDNFVKSLFTSSVPHYTLQAQSNWPLPKETTDLPKPSPMEDLVNSSQILNNPQNQLQLTHCEPDVNEFRITPHSEGIISPTNIRLRVIVLGTDYIQHSLQHPLQHEASLNLEGPRALENLLPESFIFYHLSLKHNARTTPLYRIAWQWQHQEPTLIDRVWKATQDPWIVLPPVPYRYISLSHSLSAQALPDPSAVTASQTESAETTTGSVPEPAPVQKFVQQVELKELEHFAAFDKPEPPHKIKFKTLWRNGGEAVRIQFQHKPTHPKAYAFRIKRCSLNPDPTVCDNPLVHYSFKPEVFLSSRPDTRHRYEIQSLNFLGLGPERVKYYTTKNIKQQTRIQNIRLIEPERVSDPVIIGLEPPGPLPDETRYTLEICKGTKSWCVDPDNWKPMPIDFGGPQPPGFQKPGSSWSRLLPSSWLGARVAPSLKPPMQMRVQVVNRAGESIGEPSKTLSLGGNTAQVTNLSAEPTPQGGAQITWSFMQEATSNTAENVHRKPHSVTYHIQRCPGACHTQQWTDMHRNSVGQEFLDRASLSPGQSYLYRVKPNVDSSTWSTPVRVSIPATTPGPVRALRATKITTPSPGVRLFWQAPAQDGGAPIKSYLVERAEMKESGTSWRTLGRMPASSSAYVDRGLVQNLYPGSKYLYRVKAVNAEGAGSAVQSEPILWATAPEEPTAFTARLKNPEPLREDELAVALRWQAPFPESGLKLQFYKLEWCHNTQVGLCRSIKAQWHGHKIVLSDWDNTEYTFAKNLKPAQSYSFRLRAVNSIGESLPTQSVAVQMPIVLPGIVEDVTVAVDADNPLKHRIFWRKPAFAGGGEIQKYNIKLCTESLNPASAFYCRTQNSETSAFLKQVGTAYGNAYTHTLSKSGGRYYYFVQAQNGRGLGDAAYAVARVWPKPQRALALTYSAGTLVWRAASASASAEALATKGFALAICTLGQEICQTQSGSNAWQSYPTSALLDPKKRWLKITPLLCAKGRSGQRCTPSGACFRLREEDMAQQPGPWSNVLCNLKD